MVEQDPMVGNLQAEYREVCNNFRLLTDIRFKLLALLPIGTGAGVALATTTQSTASSPLIALFGLVVTVSAALYNLRNDQLYNELVARAAHLERSLNLKEGGFAQRPRAWRLAGPLKVSHGQIWWVYLSSLAAWLFVFLHGAKPPQPSFLSWMPAELFEALIALVLVMFIGLWILVQEQIASNRLREAAAAAVHALCQIPLTSSPEHHECWASLLHHTSVLAGKKAKNVEKRLLFYLQDGAGIYWDRPPAGQSCDLRAASQLLGPVTDMPSRWIFDVASGRRA
jgi:hypothetical protein